MELLKNSGAVNNYEVSADSTSITLYWTYLKLDETKSVQLSRVLAYGGDGAVCLSRASRAFLYYDDESDVWVK